MPKNHIEPITNWGRLLREKREECGLSQRGTAKAVGINRSTLRRLEGGLPKSGFDIHVVEHLLRFYGYDLEALQRPAAREDA